MARPIRCNVTDFEIIPNDNVPDGQIWIDAPGPDGRSIRYVFDLETLGSVVEETAPTGDAND